MYYRKFLLLRVDRGNAIAAYRLPPGCSLGRVARAVELLEWSTARGVNDDAVVPISFQLNSPAIAPSP